MLIVNIGPDDADYVQVVHTDAFARGILQASGHQDFYMNGGIEQPGAFLGVLKNFVLLFKKKSSQFFINRNFIYQFSRLLWNKRTKSVQICVFIRCVHLN